MKKIVFYAARNDEIAFVNRYQDELQLDIVHLPDQLNRHTAALTDGALAVSIPGSNVVDETALKILSEQGVKYVSVRSAGFNNIDIKAAEHYGIHISNVNYSSHSVADFTVMLMLMSIRKVKQIIQRNDVQDYTIAGVQGKEMKNLTIGIIGTGKIGETVAKNLTGFGCQIIAYDLYQKEGLKTILDYVSLDELLMRSDVITLHLPLFESSYHIINRETITKMKRGVCLINCGRGPLVDTAALIAGIESGKIGAAGLDVIEDELTIFHQDHRSAILTNHALSILRAFPNVVLTPHASFYTDQAVSDMVEISLKSLIAFIDTGMSPWQIKAGNC